MKPADVLGHATSEIASGSKLGIDATKKLPGEGYELIQKLPPTLESTKRLIQTVAAL